MKRLPFYFWVSLALASCQGGKEAVNQALPVIDMNEDYPEKEIVLQDIADISYIPLETNDEFLFDGSVEVVTDQYVYKRQICDNQRTSGKRRLLLQPAGKSTQPHPQGR